MADTAFPVSFRDPLYASVDAKVTGKLGLPDGLLSSIRENGERTNADRVSEAGARTPYQIIPDTRTQAIKKWGIDPYLSPENAAEVAGLLLKDSLDRNKGDVGTAVSEYHGGTNPANWGPKTKAYVQRVTSTLGDMAPAAAAPAQPAGGAQLPGMQGPSTFDKVMAQQDAEQAPSKLQQIYQAYQSGQMTPEEQHDFESDVRAGKMMLPRGASLKDAAAAGPGAGGASPGASAQPVPPGVLQAYQSGQMTPQEMVDFEHDVKAGAWQLPQGTTPDTLFGPAHKPTGVLERVADAVTGKSRETATTQVLPDWAGMPELNQLSMASAKTGLGTLLSNPHETAQIIQANFPGVQVRQDQKGNFILRSSVDGQEYAIKPGFQVSDIPRAIGGALAFTPAGRAETLAGAALANGATQAAIEASQAATGGTFDKGEVAGAAALGTAVPAAARVLDVAAQPAKAVIGRVLGRTEPAVADARAAVTPGGADAAGAPAAADPAALPAAQPGMTVPVAVPAGPKVPAGGAAAAAPTSVEGVAQTARKAAAGSEPAKAELAGAAAPNAETAAAAERLGISNYLQPDHVTSSDAYRQVVGVLKSNPTSQLALQEKEGLANVAERASKLIDDVGGTNDLSHLDASVKSRMQAAHTELSAREDALYQKIRDTLPATTEAPAPNALAFLEQRAKDLGGEKNLSPMEKTILSKLSPKTVTTAETVAADPAKVGLMLPNAAQKVVTQEAKQPTYALLDDVRRDVGRAARQAGPFSDADTGLAKKYYGLLTQDQNAIAHGAGLGDISDAAKAATTARKGMEDDLTALFGKNLDHSLVPQVSGAMKATASGDAAKLLAVLKSVPDNMKQEVVASGMATVFRNAATRGEINFTGYAKWFDGLQRNKQAYAAVMSNLPPAARAQLVDLAKVSRGISDSLNARIKTGLRSSVLQELQGAPDTLATRLFEVAKHAGKGLAADAVGGHGAGLAMGVMSALKGNAKPNAIKAIDELLTSPEFQHLAATAGTARQEETARAFAYSKAFTRFVRAVGNPREMTNREKWVLQAMQTRNNTH